MRYFRIRNSLTAVTRNGASIDYTFDRFGRGLQGGQLTYGYQDFQCFLTSGLGAWGNLGWMFDKIGNPLMETRGVRSSTSLVDRSRSWIEHRLVRRPGVA